ncbi:Ppx/GppA phosphatase family protein [Parvularcula mediterranea]|uniref:Ppx/GppA phosphatase family protein n=1 Tax=Parvularcula mediterranea TaxID=2732508 RepID=UPI0018E9E621
MAALDLGTNNCRLMIAVPRRNGFAVVATFSRIVRLGEGLVTTGRIADSAQERAISALRECAEMVARWDVAAVRCVTTEACRMAANGAAFVERVRVETGLKLDVIGPEEEARLALSGCASLIDVHASRALLFDIGGGSTELCYLRIDGNDRRKVEMEAVASLPFGVVRLSEGLAEGSFAGEHYRLIRERVARNVREAMPDGFLEAANGESHVIGTSGTATSLASLHKGLKRYRRREVDGTWLTSDDVERLADELQAMGLEGRKKQPSIGEGRADLIMPGCSVMQGIMDATGFGRVRVADRGLREGIVTDLIAETRAERAKERHRVSSGAHAG